MATTDKPQPPRQPASDVPPGNLDNRGAPVKVAAPPEPLVTVRLLKFYGKHEPGSVIEIPVKEYQRIGPTGTRCAISDADAAKEKDSAAKAMQAAKAKAPADAIEKKAENGWAELGRLSRNLTLERRAQEARAQAELLESARAASAARR